MKRIIPVLVCLLFMAPIWAESPEESQQKLQEINRKIEANKAKIKPKKAEKKRVEKSLGQLKKELKLTELKIAKYKRNLRSTRSKQEKTRLKLNEIDATYKKKREVFKKRLIEIYKTQQLGIVEYFFAPDNLISIEESSYYFDKLLEADIELIEDIQDEYNALSREKKRLTSYANRISNLNTQISDKEKELEQKKQETTSYINTLQSQIEEIEKQNRELTQASKEITLLIRQESAGQTGYCGTGTYVKPTKGWISSKYGYRKHPIFKRRIKHNGIDIAARKGFRIVSSDSGRVIFAGESPRYRGYGKITIISHGKRPSDGKEVSSFYAHQSRILVKKGDIVNQGDEIGWVGMTGYATGPHLHFEIRVDGVPVDPLKYLSL